MKVVIKVISQQAVTTFMQRRISLLRLLVFFWLGLEALLVIFSFEKTAYNPKFVMISWFDIIDYGQFIYVILWLRVISCLLVAFNLLPDFFKYLAFATVLLHYNSNISYYNNHFYLEALIAFLCLFAVFEQRKLSRNQQRLHNRRFFLILRWLLAIVYFYTGLTKLTLPQLDLMQFGGFIVDLSLSLLALLAFRRRIYNFLLLSLGLLFHGLTIFFFQIGIFPFLMLSLIYSVYALKPRLPQFLQKIV